jgi:hypothetical protein
LIRDDLVVLMAPRPTHKAALELSQYLSTGSRNLYKIGDATPTLAKPQTHIRPLL